MDEWGSYRCPFVVQLKSWLYSFSKEKKKKKRARSNRCRCGRDHTRVGRSAVLHRGVGTGPDSPGLFTGRPADSTASASIALAKLARAPQRNAAASGAGVSARPYIRVSA